MADTIKIGTILIAEGARIPESLLLESEPYAKGWRLVKNLDSNGLDQIMSQAGWNFFYIAGGLKRTPKILMKKAPPQSDQAGHCEPDIEEL